jgi:hypothetical protein
MPFTALQALSSECRAPLTLPAVNVEGCGSDCLFGQLSLQPTNWGYAAFWQHPPGRGRSSVVSTEGVDPSLLDWGTAPEACEIGGLGTLNPQSLWERPARAFPCRLCGEG